MITMTITGGGNLVRQFEDFIRKVPFKNYADDILDYMEKQKNTNFKMQGRNMQINPVWSPLSPTTYELRAKRVGHYKNAPSRPGILRRTGNLQDNIRRTKTNISCTMTFMADYAKDHQLGAGRMHRAIFEFSNPVKAEIMRVVQTYFNKEIGIWNARK